MLYANIYLGLINFGPLCITFTVMSCIMLLHGNSGGARSFFLPGHNQGTTITGHSSLWHRHRGRTWKPGPVFFEPGFRVSRFATKSRIFFVGCADIMHDFCNAKYYRPT